MLFTENKGIRYKYRRTYALVIMAARVLKGPKSTCPKDNRNLGVYLFEQAETFGDRICQIDADTEKQETYAEVKLRATRVALKLKELGLKEDDVVLICSQNNLDNLVPFLATLYLGARVSNVDPKQHVRELAYALSIIEPTFVFVHEDSCKLLEDSFTGLKVRPKICVMGKSEKYIQMSDMEIKTAKENDFRPVRKDCHETALITFSSGTTSLPKGICLTHYGLLHSPMTLVHEIDSVKTDVIFHASSLYWISAVYLTILTFLTGGCKVLTPQMDAEKLFRIIQKYKITYIFMAPAFTYQITNLDETVLKKYDTSSLYSVHIGGSPITPIQLNKIRNILSHTKVTVAYGSSEGGFIAVFDLRDEKAYFKKTLSTGKVICDTELKVVDLETRTVLGPNEQGEICLKSPFLMKGYYKRDAFDTFDEEGFLKTGDIGYYDEDDYIYVVDRIKEMFKYKNFQVVPALIEAVLLEHTAVKEAVVFGVPHEIDGDNAAACVILKSPAAAQEIIEFVSQRVSDASRLRGGVEIVDSFPQTPSGKIQRKAVKEYFLKKRGL